ncbi:FliH/SctL family protein [Thalassolituus maritimus]|uniref:Flagellar assembly protein FliH n=1 Tax=Thalassolituus maritimus TaxID=484498 RepID=A0ABQ0A294_9GAMM
MAETRRDAPIPAESAEEARPWRLPFWTEPPVHAVEREKEESAETDNDAEEAETDAAKPDYPTADELETIRREAYNDGLEQGRIEGRQQGHKEGYEAGFAEGREAGHQEGFSSGQKEGATAGFQEGKAQGSQEAAEEAQRLRQLVATLQGSLRERDAQLPEVMVMLLTRLAEQVLEQELNTGADNITRYVDAAIDALPDGEILAKVYVSPADADLLTAHKAARMIETDNALNAGECRIESENSLVEYSVSDSLQQHLMSLAGTLLTTADGYPSDDIDENTLLESEPETDVDEETTAPRASDSSPAHHDTQVDSSSDSITEPTTESTIDSEADSAAVMTDKSSSSDQKQDQEQNDDPEQPLA